MNNSLSLVLQHFPGLPKTYLLLSLCYHHSSVNFLSDHSFQFATLFIRSFLISPISVVWLPFTCTPLWNLIFISSSTISYFPSFLVSGIISMSSSVRLKLQFTSCSFASILLYVPCSYFQHLLVASFLCISLYVGIILALDPFVSDARKI